MLEPEAQADRSSGCTTAIKWDGDAASEGQTFKLHIDASLGKADGATIGARFVANASAEEGAEGLGGVAHVKIVVQGGAVLGTDTGCAIGEANSAAQGHGVGEIAAVFDAPAGVVALEADGGGESGLGLILTMGWGCHSEQSTDPGSDTGWHPG